MLTRIIIALLFLITAAPLQAEDDPPAGTRAEWRHWRTPNFTTSQGAPEHRCRDGLHVTGEPQEFICKFAYGPWDKDLEDEDVEVFVRLDGTTTWRRLGVGRTLKDGRNDPKRGIHDMGGWMVYALAPENGLPVGRHVLRAVVQGDGSAAEAALWVVPPGSAVAIFDIDGTLTTGDGELSKELAASSAGEHYTPKIRAGAADVVRARVAAGALPVYITARPDRLAPRTRAWLTAKDLPAGPLGLQSSVKGSVSEDRTQKYKEHLLKGLLAKGISVVAAYGNAVTDIDAYLGAGIDASRVFIVGPHRGEKGTQPIERYRDHLETLAPRPRE